jgi:riboflavin synthase
MFTGIIETVGTVVQMEQEQTNVHFSIESTISSELKVDQSVSHNGVCLTVTAVEESVDGRFIHKVTAISETLKRSNLGYLELGDPINLERCLALGGRLDGHMVQGHVDAIAKCVNVEEVGGSWKYTFEYEATPELLLVDKGSVCLNGVSLTVVEPTNRQFSVAIIPYTWEHTNFKCIQANDWVNIEFDIIGKYISKYLLHYGRGVQETMLSNPSTAIE